MLEITDGMGADMFMEATGLPEIVYPGIERVIWEGRTLLSTVVVTARAEAKMDEALELLETALGFPVRRKALLPELLHPSPPVEPPPPGGRSATRRRLVAHRD